MLIEQTVVVVQVTADDPCGIAFKRKRVHPLAIYLSMPRVKTNFDPLAKMVDAEAEIIGAFKIFDTKRYA